MRKLLYCYIVSLLLLSVLMVQPIFAADKGWNENNLAKIKEALIKGMNTGKTGTKETIWYGSAEDMAILRAAGGDVVQLCSRGLDAQEKANWVTALDNYEKALALVEKGGPKHFVVLKFAVTACTGGCIDSFSARNYKACIDNFAPKGLTFAEAQENLFFKVRKAQLYYILAQCYFELGDKNKGQQYVNLLKEINTPAVLEGVSDAENMMSVQSSQDLALELDKRYSTK